MVGQRNQEKPKKRNLHRGRGERRGHREEVDRQECLSHYKLREPEWATRGLPESPRSMRPMRKNFSRRRLRSASTDRTFCGGTTRIMPPPTLSECNSSFVSIFPTLARYLKIAGTGHEARSISARTPEGSTRGKFPGMPPPVMCARAETQPRAKIFFSAGA